MVMMRVRANGLDFEVDVRGRKENPAVLLIMGLGRQLIAWPEEFVVGLVDGGYRVVLFDNRDAGLSSHVDSAGHPGLAGAALRHLLRLPVRSAYDLFDMSEDCAALLRELQISRAHIVGVSMGGMIGQVLAATHPELAISLTSIMSTSGARGLPAARRDAARAIRSRPPPTADLEQLTDHYLRVFRTIGSPGFPTPGDLLRARVKAGLARSYSPDGTERQMIAILASGDRSPLLRRIRAPTLVIHGEQDPLVPIAAGRDTARKIRGASFVAVPGMGHDLAPGLVPILLKAIIDHLQSATARRN